MGSMEGDLYSKMRESKKAYVYAIRRLKRRQANLRMEKFANAIVGDSSRDFFAEVKKQMPRKPVHDRISGHDSEAQIAEHFREKYEALYSCMASDARQNNAGH